MTSLVDILLLLTNTGAVSEFLMIQHMKDLQGMYNPKSDSHTLSFPVRGQARFGPQSTLLVVRGDDIGPLVESSKTEAYNPQKSYHGKSPSCSKALNAF